jgi:cell wall-associated NlpC family hydrolase
VRVTKRRAVPPLLLVALVVTSAPTAAADPRYPAGPDVAGTRTAAVTAAGDVTAVQAQLGEAAARSEAADVALSVAAEEYDSAVLELRAKQRAAREAEATAAAARGRLGAARRDVGRLAAQAYRGGGTLGRLAVVLSPAGPQDVADRIDFTRTVAGHRQAVVRRMDAARATATLLDRQATDAVAAAARATATLDAARRTAEARAAAAHAVQAETARRQDALLERLATLRRTSVELERQRQAGIAAAAERAARAAAERAERPTEGTATSPGGPGSPGGSGSPGGNGSSGSNGTAPGEPGGSGAGPGRTTPARPPAAEPAPRQPPAAEPVPRQPPATGGSSGSASGGAAAVAWAKRQVGLPYKWGGEGPGSYDCSGLTMRAWERSGVSLPHSSRAQYAQSRKVPYAQLRPGDLLFFATNPGNPRTIHHVTMYAGGGLMVEAPMTGKNVRVVPMRYSDRMPWAGRP